LGLSHNDLFDKGVDPSALPATRMSRRRKNFRSRSPSDDQTKLREELVKIRLLALVGLAIGFALPTFAQQTNTPDPQLHQQLVALFKKLDEVWNSNDHGAWAALFTDDAIEVTNTEPIYGRNALEKNWADLKLQFSNHVTTVDQFSLT